MAATNTKLTQSGLVEYFGGYTVEMLHYLEDEAGCVPIELNTKELVSIEAFIEDHFEL